MPASIDEAITAFGARRDALEHEYGVCLPRALEDEVLEGKRRLSRTSWSLGSHGRSPAMR